MGDNIYKAIRTELGFTQKDLGELLGIDAPQISRAENGHDTPALYEYALKGLKAENAPEPAAPAEDVEPLKARIAELEELVGGVDALNAEVTQLREQLEAASNPQPAPSHPAPEQPAPAPAHVPSQPKKRSGLGRRSNAPEFKND